MNSVLRRHAPALGVLLIVAFALRIIWISSVHPDPYDGRFDDSVYYRGTAHFIAEGEGYINPAFATPTAAWPPGYPFFLAGVFKAFGEGETQTYVANVVLATLTVAVVYAIGCMLFGWRTALVAAAAVAVWPGQVYFASITLSEPLFTLLFTSAFALMLAVPRVAQRYRAPVVIAFGLVTVLAMLTRGQAGLLLPLAPVAWLMSGMRWRPALGWGTLAAFVVAVALAPWVARNQRQMGSPVIIATNVGINIWLGHHDGATGRLVLNHPLPAPDDPNLSHEEFEVQSSNIMVRKGLGYMLTHPADEFRLARTKIRAMYESDATGLDWNSGYTPGFYSSAERERLLRDVANGFWFGALVLAGLGLVVSRGSLRGAVGILPLTVLAWTLLHLLFFGDPRFHYPIVFIVSLLAARGLVALYETVRRPQPGLGGRYAPA